MAKRKDTKKKKFRSRILRFIVQLSAIGCMAIFLLVIYSDAEIQQKFSENRWVVPAKVYGRSLALSLNQPMTTQQLSEELKLLDYRKAIKANKPGEYEQYGDYFSVFIRQFNNQYGVQPARKINVLIQKNRIVESKVVEKSNGDVAQLEPMEIGQTNPLITEDRKLIKIESVPTFLIDALIVSEDRDFYNHWGVSLKGIFRAFTRNIQQGKLVEGGSTITQQLIKNYFLTSERSVWRKVREAIMAMTLEYRYDKSEILQAYMNEVYMGQKGAKSIHGFAMASEYYFDTSIESLTLAQAATLVAIIRGPSYYDPLKHPQRSRMRRDRILDQLLEGDRITDRQWQAAKDKELIVVDSHHKRRSKYSSVLDLVRKQLKQHYSQEQLNHDGLHVFTSIDPQVQHHAENSLAERIQWIENNRNNVGNDLQGAIVVSERSTGEVRAIVGDRDPLYAGFNRALHAYRQVGSTIKPFVYAAAIERASEFNLLTKLEDQSFTLTATDGSIWAPKNYDDLEHGEVNLLTAFTQSYNLATARLALDVGIENIIQLLYRSGFERELFAYPSLALGAQEMSPWEVLKLYQTLATGGRNVRTSVVTAVTNSDGQLLDRYPTTAKQVLTPESVAIVNYVLQNVVKNGTAKSLDSQLPYGKFAGKTGTTNDLKDSWFTGFSENYLAVVWLGKDDNQTTGLTGASGALNVWGDFIQKVEFESLELENTPGVEWGKDGWFGECLPFVAGNLPRDLSSCSPN